MNQIPLPTIVRLARVSGGDIIAVIGVSTKDGETYTYHRYLAEKDGCVELDFSSGAYRTQTIPLNLFKTTLETEGQS